MDMSAAAGTAPATKALSVILSAGNGGLAGITGDAANDAEAQIAVSGTDTRKQRRPRKENGEFFAMTRRMIRAAGRRVETRDPSDLAEMLTLQAELDAVITRTAQGLAAGGFSWSEIAQGAGLSKMAAYKRWAGR
jgi:hypothetical protein